MGDLHDRLLAAMRVFEQAEAQTEHQYEDAGKAGEPGRHLQDAQGRTRKRRKVDRMIGMEKGAHD